MTQPAAIDWRSLAALVFEWLLIVAAIGGAIALDSLWAVAAAALVVPTRQHALLILYHDAVHGHFARRRRVNDFIVNMAIGVPMFMPVEVYRPLHLQHHGALGTDTDPERQLLYAGQAWRYRPLPAGQLLRQLAGDLLFMNGIRTLVAWRGYGPMPQLAPQTWTLVLVWLAAAGIGFTLAPAATALALVLWVLPLLTLTQLLQKLRSFAEHSGGPGVTPGWPDWTYSWRVGLAGRLTIWPYHINLHREHHLRPALRWHELPAVADPHRQLAGSVLWRLLRRPDAVRAPG